MPVPGSTPGDLSADELARAARARVFFGHQSVGMNVLDAVPGVFAEAGVPAPPITEDDVDGDGGVVVHAFVGRNGQPLEKIRDFDARMRGGAADRADVALLKLCYVDVGPGTDVEALFAAYRDTLTALTRDFPRVTTLAVTVPVTTVPAATAPPSTVRALKNRVKALLGRTDPLAPAAAVARERFNALVRAEFPPGRRFDLAAVESTAPDGSRVRGHYQGHDYDALYEGYASDPGHLGTTGARVAAAAWLAAIARAS